MTSPLLTLNHLLILARDCYDESSNTSNALYKAELQEAIEYNELLLCSNLDEWEHFFKLNQHFGSKVQANYLATGWKEALEITRQQSDRYRKNFTTSYIKQMKTAQQGTALPQFNMAEANKRASELAAELSALLKQIAAHS